MSNTLFNNNYVIFKISVFINIGYTRETPTLNEAKLSTQAQKYTNGPAPCAALMEFIKGLYCFHSTRILHYRSACPVALDHFFNFLVFLTFCMQIWSLTPELYFGRVSWTSTQTAKFQSGRFSSKNAP